MVVVVVVVVVVTMVVFGRCGCRCFQVVHVRVMCGWPTGSDTPLFVRGRLHLDLLDFSAVEVDHHHRLPDSDGHRERKLAVQEVINLEGQG